LRFRSAGSTARVCHSSAFPAILQRIMRGQIGAHRRDRDIAVQIDRGIGARRGRQMLRAALDPQEPRPVGEICGSTPKNVSVAVALRRHAQPFDIAAATGGKLTL
jgi:hypothetical protein